MTCEENFKWLDDLEFGIYEAKNDRLDQNWSEVGGLYVFAQRVRDHRGTCSWQALYVGQTGSFDSRLPNHENWPEAAKLGASHVHLCPEENESCRLWLEKEMIEKHDPPLNIQHK